MSDFLTLKDLLTHNHSHDNIKNHNDYKAVDVENEVQSDNATENNVAWVMSTVLMLTRFLC